MLLTGVTDVVSARYLVDQRERIASRQAVINGIFVEGHLVRDGEDLSTALEAVRLGAGTDAVVTSPTSSASTAIGLSAQDLPKDLVSATEDGTPSLERFRETDAGNRCGCSACGWVHLLRGERARESRHHAADDHLGRYRCRTAHDSAWRRVGLVAASRVLRPLNDVAKAATRLASGDLDARAPTTTDPDLTAISSSFNAMAETRRVESCATRSLPLTSS